MGEKKGKLAILKEFFGPREGEGTKEFVEECQELSDLEKLELAQLAAAELGYTAEQVSFQL